MTLSDLEWHFALNFHYYEQRFQKLFYVHVTCPRESLFYRRFLLYHVTSRDVREADYDLQNIWDPRKDSGSFVYEKLRALYIVGTLTNKDNILSRLSFSH